MIKSPREYIQHNPEALSGREPAIEFLTELWGRPGMSFTNITAWAGEGIGMLHYR
jgi:predicted SnoaL-like aldol condensation-catalyzing enzyme